MAALDTSRAAARMRVVGAVVKGADGFMDDEKRHEELMTVLNRINTLLYDLAAHHRIAADKKHHEELMKTQEKISHQLDDLMRHARIVGYIITFSAILFVLYTLHVSPRWLLKPWW